MRKQTSPLRCIHTDGKQLLEDGHTHRISAEPCSTSAAPTNTSQHSPVPQHHELQQVYVLAVILSSSSASLAKPKATDTGFMRVISRVYFHTTAINISRIPATYAGHLRHQQLSLAPLDPLKKEAGKTPSQQALMQVN